MADIVEAVKETVRLDILPRMKSLYADKDRFLILLLTASIFAPFYFSVVVVSFIAIMTMIDYRKRVYAFNAPYTKLLFLFLVAGFFVAAIYNNYQGMMYSIIICAAMVCALYMRSVMTRSIFNQAMDLVCIASIWCLFIAVYQKAVTLASAPTYRPVSVFTNANYYGMMIEFVILIALYRVFTNPGLRAFYWAVIGMNFLGLYLTASFSSFAAMVCSVTVLLLLKKKYRFSAVFLMLAVSFLVLGILFPVILPRGSEAMDTLAQRLSIWCAALQGIRHHPFIGEGAMSYQMIYDQFGGYKTYHCHNLYLDTLLNFGIAGFSMLAFYLVMQMKIVLLRFRNNICGNMSILLMAALVAVFVHGMTDVTILWIQTGTLFLLISSSVGIGSSYVEHKFPVPEFRPDYAGETLSQRA